MFESGAQTAVVPRRGVRDESRTAKGSRETEPQLGPAEWLQSADTANLSRHATLSSSSLLLFVSAVQVTELSAGVGGVAGAATWCASLAGLGVLVGGCWGGCCSCVGCLSSNATSATNSIRRQVLPHLLS